MKEISKKKKEITQQEWHFWAKGNPRFRAWESLFSGNPTAVVNPGVEDRKNDPCSSRRRVGQAFLHQRHKGVEVGGIPLRA